LNRVSILSKKSIVGIVTAASVLSIIIMISVLPAKTPTTNIITPFGAAGGNALLANAEEKHIVPLDQIVSGGPPPDGIPSIDNPKFVSVQEANGFLGDSDLILGLNINGDIRAYPLQILVWHEIVNDRVGGVPIAVTYCPLCFTNQVFNRMLSDKTVVEFGTSGRLYNSNLVMYDRTSKSLWSQALAEGIVGKYAGTKLERIPFDVANWKNWKQLYPNTRVLSRDTGNIRPYGADPYDGYYSSTELFFPVSHRDDRLGLKEIIVGLESGGLYKAYKLQQIENNKVINDEINGRPVTLLSLYPHMTRAYASSVDGKTLTFEYMGASSGKIKDKQSGTEWNFEGMAVSGQMKGKHLTRLPFDQGFWFEWAAFHPMTGLHS
jgi:Protein of unknown function (DUF3179)